MVKRLWVGFMAIILTACILPNLTNTNSLAQTRDDMYAHSIMATVKIIYTVRSTDIYGDTMEESNIGSGVLICPNQVITCYHLFADCIPGKIKIYIMLIGKTLMRDDVTIRKYSKKDDLALLIINPPVEDISPIPIAALTPQLGTDVRFVGHTILPVTRLRFSKFSESLKGIMISPVFFGDSGGGVFNTKGELIGIIYTTYRIDFNNDHQYTLIGYALPIDRITEFLDE